MSDLLAGSSSGRAPSAGHRHEKSRQSCDAPAFLFAIAAAHTLTSGPREAGPFDPPPGPLGFGLRGTVRLRAPGNFSGFGVTGASGNSKPIFSCVGAVGALR